MIIIFLSCIALFLTITIKSCVGIPLINTVALFFGLEGTVLLASALSLPRDEIEVPNKKGFMHWLKWWNAEGKNYRYPVSYNPVCFYGGLLFLALSMILSSISN